MSPRMTAGTESQRKQRDLTAGSEHHRQSGNDAEAHDWWDGTGFVGRWKRAVVRAERDLLRFGTAVALLDVVTALSVCFAPLLRPIFFVVRLGALTVLIPAVLRALAIAHADRDDSDLVKAIAIAIGLTGAYIAVRTYVVVQMCSL